MTPEEAWAKAMSFEHRPNPYPFFDELRKTPVVHVGNGVYVVTGYRELMALAHDPRISSDMRRLKARAATTAGSESDPSLEAYGEHGSMIQSDPPEHDKMRRQSMRHFGPPHNTSLIPSTAPAISKLCNDLLDKAKGKTRIDIVDDYAYPLPVMVICKILGVPLKDEPQFHAWIHDFMAGLMDMGPEAATEEGKVRVAKGKESAALLMAYLTDLITRFMKEPSDAMLSKMVNEDGPDGRMTPREAVSNAALLLVAGHDSTVNTISHCVLTLLRNPGSSFCARGRNSSPSPSRRCCGSSRLCSSFRAGLLRMTSRSLERSFRRGLLSTSCTAPPTAIRNGSPTRTSSTPNARTTSISAGAAASTLASVVHSRVWR
jgi:fatty acid omega-hydroxylase